MLISLKRCTLIENQMTRREVNLTVRWNSLVLKYTRVLIRTCGECDPSSLFSHSSSSSVMADVVGGCIKNLIFWKEIILTRL